MSDYKFDTFYYIVDKSNEHYLSELENLSDQDYERLYKGKMLCPSCQTPQLSRVKKEGNCFLRTYPKQHHVFVDGEMCPYECDTASQTLMRNYIQELHNKKKIQSHLEAVMRTLFKKDLEKHILPKVTETHTKSPLLIESIKNNKTVKKNIIPHYSFKSWGKNIPQEQLLIVYGKVYIQLKTIYTDDKKGGTVPVTYIHFNDINSKKLISSCTKPPTMKIQEGNYYAVVLGTCHQKTFKEHVYYNIWVNSPVEQSILLKPFSP